MIGGQQDVIENDALLDVLGVNLIMQAAGGAAASFHIACDGPSATARRWPVRRTCA